MKGIVKKIPRKAVAYIVVFALCITYLGTPGGMKKVKAVTSKDQEWEYIENGDGTIAISGYYGTRANLVIPEIVDDKPVTKIWEGAFLQNTYLNSVLISNKITEIDGSAFLGCSNLERITIPNSVQSIGNNTFDGCINLSSIEIPNSVISIGEAAFANCKGLKSVKLSNNLISIEACLFLNCNNLSSITMPDSVAEIGSQAFSGCSSLSSVTLSANIVSIGEKGFCCCSNLKSITISENVTNIGENAFEGCYNLVIYAASGSYAATYANEHGIEVQLTDVSGPIVRPTPIPTPTPSPKPEITIPPVTRIPTPTIEPPVILPATPTPTIEPPVVLPATPTPTIEPPVTLPPMSTPTVEPLVTLTPMPTVEPPTPTPVITPMPTVDSTFTPTTTPTEEPVATNPPVLGDTPTPDFGNNGDDDSQEKQSQKIYAKSVTKEYSANDMFSLMATVDSYEKLTYSSSYKKAVTVDNYGWVTIKGYGRATITITAPETSKYKKATKKITVTIIPKQVAVKTLKSPVAKKVVYSWKKDATVSGYQIYGSLKKNFNSNTFKRVIKSDTSLSLRGLKSKKVYYFKVRSYKLVGEKKYYSQWSKIKKVKIK